MSLGFGTFRVGDPADCFKENQAAKGCTPRPGTVPISPKLAPVANRVFLTPDGLPAAFGIWRQCDAFPVVPLAGKPGNFALQFFNRLGVAHGGIGLEKYETWEIGLRCKQVGVIENLLIFQWKKKIP
jgi:hypothetical protein